MRRLKAPRWWRLRQLRRRLKSMDQPLGVTAVGRCSVPQSPPPVERQDEPLMTLGQRLLYRVPEAGL